MTSYDFAETTNYAETIRTNADLNPIGLQTLCIDLDYAGVPQSYTETELKHNAKQEIVFPLTAPYTYTTTKDIADIKGNTTDRLLVSYVDGSDEVIPPAFGAELVVNGSFDTDTAWAKGTGWAISAGSANCNGTQVAESELQSVNSVVLTAGKSYQLFLSIGSVSAGAFKISAGDGSTGWLGTSGVYTHAFVHGGGNIYVDIIADADFIGSINSISIKEIL